MPSVFSPPTFPDEAKTEAARTFRTVALVTALIVTVAAPLILVIQPDAWRLVVGPFVVVNGVVLITLALNRRGRTTPAAWLYLSVLVILFTVNALFAEGIRSPGVQAYLAFVILAGLLLNEFGGVVFAVGCAVLGLILVVLETTGALPSARTIWGPTARWLVTCAYMGIALMVMRLSTRAIASALARAQRELNERRATQQQLEHALDAGTIGIFQYDTGARAFRADIRALALTGLTADVDGIVAYAQCERAIHPDDRPRLAQTFHKLLAGLRQSGISCRIRRPDGSERHLEASAYMVNADAGGSATIVGTILDITERVEAEREREHLVVDLGERIKELRLLHNATELLQQRRPVDLALLTELVAMIPRAWLDPDDCRARIVYGQMDVRSAGWRSSPWTLVASFSTSGGPGSVEVAYRSEHPTRDEGPFLREERAVIDSLAQLLRSYIEEQAAEHQRREMEAQLRQGQKMEALGTLAGGIAHDFNNILTAIGGNAELALGELPPESQARESVDEIIRAHARARDLVNRILLFSRRQESAKKPVALAPVVQEALKLLRASLPTNIQIVTAVAAGLPRVNADATQVHQIIMNLGTNAGYAMGDFGGTLSVDLAAVAIDDAATPSTDLAAGRHLCITVRDTGSGMTEVIRDRLFEPFFTTKGPAGTGLGLSVVHGIVRDHGGAITVDSELGSGTAFRIYLPAVGASEEHTAPVATDVLRGRGEHIMYVDDEEALTHLMSRMLVRLGYACTTFTSADAALQEFRTYPHRFAAVVTDMQMPTLSGLDLARSIRVLNPDVPIAVISGYSVTDSSGLDVHWLQKPTTMLHLSRALRNMLEPTNVRP